MRFQLKVLFRTGQFTIDQQYDQHLTDAAVFLKKHPDAVLDVAGHTDTQGNPKINGLLSQRRVEAVRDHLIRLGVSPSQIRTSAHSQDQPASGNDTSVGMSENRRVVGVIEADGIGDEPTLQGAPQVQ